MTTLAPSPPTEAGERMVLQLNDLKVEACLLAERARQVEDPSALCVYFKPE